MPCQVGDRRALDARERRGERGLLLRARGPFVGDVEAAAGLGGEAGDGVEHAAGQDEAAVEGLVVAVQEPGVVPGGGPHPQRKTRALPADRVLSRLRDA
jgi:hypothetical protein